MLIIFRQPHGILFLNLREMFDWLKYVQCFIKMDLHLQSWTPHISARNNGKTWGLCMIRLGYMYLCYSGRRWFSAPRPSILRARSYDTGQRVSSWSSHKPNIVSEMTYGILTIETYASKPLPKSPDLWGSDRRGRRSFRPRTMNLRPWKGGFGLDAAGWIYVPKWTFLTKKKTTL